MKAPKHIILILAFTGLAALVVGARIPWTAAAEWPNASATGKPDVRRWQAVAAGRVEPRSGEIRIAAPIVGRIGDVMVKVNDKVFAGEPLIRLEDDEVWARFLVAEAQVAMHKRARDAQPPVGKAITRRRAEDAVAEGERSFIEARSDLDRLAAASRAGNATAADIETARATLARVRDNLMQSKAELRRIEADSATPLPGQTAGQLNVARSELLGVAAAVDKLTIRAPIGGTVLQINAKIGELATPSVAQQLVLLGDISSLRVRADLDERNFGDIGIGQSAMVRAAAFRGQEFAGKVVSIAPIIQSSRIGSRDQRSLTDVNVTEVVVDLAEHGPLVVGMKVDVYFSYAAPK